MLRLIVSLRDGLCDFLCSLIRTGDLVFQPGRFFTSAQGAVLHVSSPHSLSCMKHEKIIKSLWHTALEVATSRLWRYGRDAEFLPTYEKHNRWVMSDSAVPRSQHILSGTFLLKHLCTWAVSYDVESFLTSVSTGALAFIPKIDWYDYVHKPTQRSVKHCLSGNTCDLSKLREKCVNCTKLGRTVAKLFFQSWEKKLEQGIKKAGWHGLRTSM